MPMLTLDQAHAAVPTACPCCGLEAAVDAVGRRAAMLREMGELCLEVAREVRRRVVEAPPAVVLDAGLTLSRLARALRLTLALETRFLDDQQVRDLAQDEPAIEPADTQTVRIYLRRGHIRRLVEDTVRAEVEASARTPAEAERLLADLDERLEEDFDPDFDLRPTAELVERLCTEFGVAFNPGLMAPDAWDDPPSHLGAAPFDPPPRAPPNTAWGFLPGARAQAP